ncbi:hypothetical protein L195_g006876 [Trifolium pratense]|uniref:Transmembrane protein n=1 Tax=Trifolium pratense TaxID=57577 RepID=A0A2K3P4S9_TRIPR|nr:hypothetical protein L195_g006876 [Trifolium pratense]
MITPRRSHIFWWCDRGHSVASPPSLIGVGSRVFWWFGAPFGSCSSSGLNGFCLGFVWVMFAVGGGIGCTGGFSGGFVGCFFFQMVLFGFARKGMEVFRFFGVGSGTSFLAVVVVQLDGGAIRIGRIFPFLLFEPLSKAIRSRVFSPLSRNC